MLSAASKRIVSSKKLYQKIIYLQKSRIIVKKYLTPMRKAKLRGVGVK